MRLSTYLLLALALLTYATPVSAAALININTASATSLDSLPGIGPSKAAAIVTYRTEHGPFAAKKDIQNVSGIGPATYVKLENLITVEIATVSPPPMPTQETKPSPVVTSYTKTQPVDPVVTTKEITKTHEDAVLAPTEAPQIAAVGAALDSARVETSAPKIRAEGLFHSVWTLGLLGVVIVAGGVFILL